jgi:hypothetical protein
MRRLLVTLAVGVVASLIGLAATVPATAEVVVNERREHVIASGNCMGERVVAVGEVHIVTAQQPNGRFHHHVNGHFTGTDASGRKYEGHLITKEKFDGEVFTFRQRYHLISQGSTENFFITITFTQPPGTITTEVECRG